jgi:hypothetical protein
MPSSSSVCLELFRAVGGWIERLKKILFFKKKKKKNMCNIRIIINIQCALTPVFNVISLFWREKFWLTYTPGKTPEEDKNNIACVKMRRRLKKKRKVKKNEGLLCCVLFYTFYSVDAGGDGGGVECIERGL